MRTVATLCFAVLALGPELLAQGLCGTQLKGLKPLPPLGCSDMTAKCTCGPTGRDCHWEWICTDASVSDTDSSIPLGYRSPVVPKLFPNLLETMLQVQALRALQDKPASAPPAPAVPEPKEERFSVELIRTEGWFNGRHWRSLSPLGKVSHLIGYKEGYIDALVLSGKDYTTAKPLIELVPSQPFGEQVEMLDHFYATPENRAIPINQALRLCGRKAAGLSQVDFDAAVENARSRSSTSTMKR